MSGPSPRHVAAAATLHDTVVLFGGNQTKTAAGELINVALGDTWTWDGTSWTEQQVAGPSPRFGATMASLGNHVVLFGGSALVNGVSDPFADTWTWDGVQWIEQHVTGPGARNAPAAAALGDHVVLFGGYSAGAGFLGDTWTWDGSAWTALDSSGPTARQPAILARF